MRVEGRGLRVEGLGFGVQGLSRNGRHEVDDCLVEAQPPRPCRRARLGEGAYRVSRSTPRLSRPLLARTAPTAIISIDSIIVTIHCFSSSFLL